MRELTEKKKLEIIKFFLEGCSYDEISTKSGVAKGTVVNVVTEFRSGRFPTLTNIADLVDVFRELSVELKKRGIGVSEALLGSAFFFRLSEMGVTPEKLELWVKMCRDISPPEAPLQDFTAIALKLFRLTQETGESYDSIVTRWTKLHSESGSLEKKVTDLRSAKSELKRTRATLTEQIKTLTAKKSELDRAVGELSVRHEALKKASSDLETRHRRLKIEVAQLEAKSSALGPVVERLETLGFDINELKTLRAKLEELASGEGLSTQDLKARFFGELAAYGAVLSFEKKEKELQAVVTGLETKAQSLEKAAARLGPAEEVDEAIGCLASLKRKRVRPAAVVSYYRVLSQAGIEATQLERQVLEFGGLRKAITSHNGALTKLTEQEAEHTRVIEVLRAEEAGIKAAIKRLVESGQMVIEQAQRNALTAMENTMQSMTKELREWGDARAELGDCLEDLKRARYFTKIPLTKEGLESFVDDAGSLIIGQYLQIAALWCSRKLNPKMRPPKAILKKYYSISEYTEVELADIITWALLALMEGVSSDQGRA